MTEEPPAGWDGSNCPQHACPAASPPTLRPAPYPPPTGSAVNRPNAPRTGCPTLQAIRGGGPFYGVVTSWRFRLTRAPLKVAVRFLGFPLPLTQAGYTAALTAFNAWQPWNLADDFAGVELFAGTNVGAGACAASWAAAGAAGAPPTPICWNCRRLLLLPSTLDELAPLDLLACRPPSGRSCTTTPPCPLPPRACGPCGRSRTADLPSPSMPPPPSLACRPPSGRSCITTPPCPPSHPGLQTMRVELHYWGTLAQLDAAVASSPLLKVPGVTTKSERETDWGTYIAGVNNIKGKTVRWPPGGRVGPGGQCVTRAVARAVTWWLTGGRLMVWLPPPVRPPASAPQPSTLCCSSLLATSRWLPLLTFLLRLQDWGLSNLELGAVLAEDSNQRSSFRAASLMHFEALSPEVGRAPWLTTAPIAQAMSVGAHSAAHSSPCQA